MFPTMRAGVTGRLRLFGGARAGLLIMCVLLYASLGPAALGSRRHQRQVVPPSAAQLATVAMGGAQDATATVADGAVGPPPRPTQISSVRQVSSGEMVIRAVAFGAQQTRLVPRYYDIRACDDKPHYMHIYNVTLAIDDEGADLVTAVGSMDVPMKIVKELVIMANRCSGSVSPSHCEYYGRWSFVNNLCTLTVARGMLWTPFVDSVSPPFKCPHPEGIRYVNNATLDLVMVQMLLGFGSLEKFIWPVEVQLRNEKDQLAICIQGTVELRRVLMKTKT